VDRKNVMGTNTRTHFNGERERERERDLLTDGLWSLAHLNHEWKERQVLVEFHKALIYMQFELKRWSGFLKHKLEINLKFYEL